MLHSSDHFYLVRGNHEAEEVNRVYGFENEVLDKYNAKVFQHFQDVFDWLPVSHLVNSSVLVMHGGLPCTKLPRAKSSGSNGEHDQQHMDSSDEEDEAVVTLEDIRSLRRGCPVPKQGLMCDLLWADPRVSSPCMPRTKGANDMF